MWKVGGSKPLSFYVSHCTLTLSSAIFVHMKLSRLLIVVLFGVSISLSCKKDNPDESSQYIDDVVGPTQYGVPFADIPAIEDVVMYEVNLRAFSSGGDIQGVIDKLDHIESLGINVIWLMPIYPIGEINSVNSPYSISNYTAVANEYGTMDDLRELTDEAHLRGMAVILDWVANHTAWDHPWISNTDWYTQDSEGNIIHPPGTNWEDVADLNFDNQDMRLAMIEAMKYWALEANVDGFRCDYADGVPNDFWQQAWDEIGTLPNREFILFAEGSSDGLFDAGFDLKFGWDAYGGIMDAFDGQPTTSIFTSNNGEYQGVSAGKEWVRFTTNHDESAWNETPITMFGGVDAALAASVVAIFTGGVPLIYGSQEVGTSGNVPFFSNSTINWNANPDMLDAYQKILQFYTSSDAAKQGYNSVYAHNDVACFKKAFEGQEVLILVNIRNQEVTYSMPTPLNGTSWTNAMTGASITLNSEITLGAYEYVILEE